MIENWKQVRVVTTLLLVGGLIGGGVAWSLRPVASPLHLQASSTHGNDAFAIATGQIDDGVEGLFLLDYLTGELQCLVMNPRVGKFLAKYSINVINVLGVDQQKRPRYLMVTGAVPFPRGAAAARPGETVVYVVDANTGNFAAFGVPWNRTAAQTMQPQGGGFTLLDGGKARSIEISE